MPDDDDGFVPPDSAPAADLPQHARERLVEMRKKRFFTSDLSVSEFLLVKEAGFEPLGLVMGSSIYHVGYQLARWGKNVELDKLTQALYHCRELALGRMEEEADALGADGIVGVRLTVNLHAWGEHVAEFMAIGTAVRHVGGGNFRTPAGKPFTSDLSGQDFWTLLRAGYRPLGFVMGNCVYTWPTGGSSRGSRRRAATWSCPTTRRRSTTRASSPWSACRRRARRSAPRGSSACSSTRRATAGART